MPEEEEAAVVVVGEAEVVTELNVTCSVTD
jgi:hypothetical protein